MTWPGFPTVKIGTSATNDRSLSGAVWARCPDNISNPDVGVAIYDDFLNAPLANPTLTTEADIYGSGLKGFVEATGTILQTAGPTDARGVLALKETTTDKPAVIATTALPFKIIRGVASFWFECRVKVSVITDSKAMNFIGLVEQQTLSATVPVAAAGTMADANFVGFQRFEADGDQFDTTYKANGVTQVVVQADAVQLVADTYVKLGMYFNANNHVLTFFKNGVALSSTKTIPTAAGTDFPNDVQLGLCAVTQNTTDGDDHTLSIDWWAAAQENY